MPIHAASTVFIGESWNAWRSHRASEQGPIRVARDSYVILIGSLRSSAQALPKPGDVVPDAKFAADRLEHANRLETQALMKRETARIGRLTPANALQ